MCQGSVFFARHFIQIFVFFISDQKCSQTCAPFDRRATLVIWGTSDSATFLIFRKLTFVKMNVAKKFAWYIYAGSNLSLLISHL